MGINDFNFDGLNADPESAASQRGAQMGQDSLDAMKRARMRLTGSAGQAAGVAGQTGWPVRQTSLKED